MRCMTLETILLFATTQFFFSLMPGPAVLLVASYGLKSGTRAALAADAGVNVGNFVYIFVSALGLGAIFATSELAFEIVKYAGAAYLIFIGARTICRAGAETPADASLPRRLLDRPFVQAVLTQLANPKAVLFWGALIPQFIDTTAPLIPQYLTIAVVGAIIEFPVLGTYGWLAAQGRKLGASRSFVIWRERIAGGVMIFVGTMFATLRRAA